MIYKDLIIKVNDILSNTYPIKTKNFNNLSHFKIEFNDNNNFLPFQIDINGNIVSGEFKDKQINKVITKNRIYKWKEYLLFYVSLLNIQYNPCISEKTFLYLLHTYNYIDDLNIIKLIIDNKLEINIKYVSNIKYKLYSNDVLIKIHKINKDNHFYLMSFNIEQNFKNLGNEMNRLFINRDKFNSIHFHLDNNYGGDIVPAHLILRCLVGKKEKWMKNIKKILIDKTYFEWDCWNEENEDYKIIKDLNLNIIPNYETKYNGKIYLYMNNINSSAAWFFITYLIYAFSDKIKRFNKKCFGQTIKFGTIISKQLILKGHSGTTSGDGNPIYINYKNIKIRCPTEQFVSCSIKNIDWNRFWIE